MHDNELTRLAELAERLDCLYGRTPEEEKEIEAIVDELRTLAQQKGNAGGVVECQHISITSNGDGSIVFCNKCKADLSPPPAERHAGAVDVVGFAPFGNGGYGKAVALLGYAGRTEAEVTGFVHARARAEGFKGSAQDRLQSLGWDIRPLTASIALAPQPKDAT